MSYGRGGGVRKKTFNWRCWYYLNSVSSRPLSFMALFSPVLYFLPFLCYFLSLVIKQRSFKHPFNVRLLSIKRVWPSTTIFLYDDIYIHPFAYNIPYALVVLIHFMSRLCMYTEMGTQYCRFVTDIWSNIHIYTWEDVWEEFCVLILPV